jgi:hypothetical protein
MPSSKKMLWAGRVASGLPALLVLFGSIPKLLQLPAVIDGFRQAGLPPSTVLPVGIIEFACTLVYLIPRTRFLGAILMTGVLGGAVATNVRMGDPTWILPALCGVLVWGGLFLRDEPLRALIPVRD